MSLYTYTTMHSSAESRAAISSREAKADSSSHRQMPQASLSLDGSGLQRVEAETVGDRMKSSLH